MKNINSYFAVLIVTVAGAGAALLIIHLAYANTFTILRVGNQGEYSSLQQSLLK